MIGIVGFGKLGHALARVLRNHSYGVEGVDTSPERQLAGSIDCFTVTSNTANLKACDLIFVVVNTACPDGYRYYNLEAALESLQGFDCPVVISSTCEPKFFQDHPDLRVVYNPFFIRQGVIEEDLQHPDLVLIGDDYDLAWPLMRLWAHVLPRSQGCGSPIEKTSIINAAVTKLAINTYLAMKISYANMVGDLCVRLGAEPDRVLELVGQDKRVNPRYLKYGFGYGGPCLPIDVEAMQRTLNQNSFRPALADAVATENRLHLLFQVQDFMRQHDPNEPTTISDVAYREGTDILVRSQQLGFAVALMEFGYRVTLCATLSIIEQVQSLYGSKFSYEIHPD